MWINEIQALRKTIIIDYHQCSNYHTFQDKPACHLLIRFMQIPPVEIQRLGFFYLKITEARIQQADVFFPLQWQWTWVNLRLQQYKQLFAGDGRDHGSRKEWSNQKTRQWVKGHRYSITLSSTLHYSLHTREMHLQDRDTHTRVYSCPSTTKLLKG